MRHICCVFVVVFVFHMIYNVSWWSSWELVSQSIVIFSHLLIKTNSQDVIRLSNSSLHTRVRDHVHDRGLHDHVRILHDHGRIRDRVRDHVRKMDSSRIRSLAWQQPCWWQRGWRRQEWQCSWSWWCCWCCGNRNNDEVLYCPPFILHSLSSPPIKSFESILMTCRLNYYLVSWSRYIDCRLVTATCSHLFCLELLVTQPFPSEWFSIHVLIQIVILYCVAWIDLSRYSHKISHRNLCKVYNLSQAQSNDLIGN